MVDKFPPIPPHDGGKLRSAAILTRLARRVDVVLCTFDDGEVDRQTYQALGVDLRTVPWSPTAVHVARGVARTGTVSSARFWDTRLAAVVRQAASEVATDTLLVEHGQLSPYLAVGAGARRVLDLHNVDSELARSYAGSATSVLRRGAAIAETAMLRRLERTAIGLAEVVVTVSKEDAARLPARPKELIVCPNGTDPGPVSSPSDDPIVVFSALFSWRPNIDAALWFVRQIWPSVVHRCPGARLRLVGKDPAPPVLALRSADVEVTGTVPDVRPFLRDARVAIAPLLAGGGTRIKILEALAAGRPVVATSVGAQGLGDLVGSGLICADSAADLANEVSALLLDRDRATELGHAGGRAVAERYSWDHVLRPMLERVTT
jgi:glycosyltransferase involved in cell wall biosynthesis